MRRVRDDAFIEVDYNQESIDEGRVTEFLRRVRSPIVTVDDIIDVMSFDKVPSDTDLRDLLEMGREQTRLDRQFYYENDPSFNEQNKHTIGKTTQAKAMMYYRLAHQIRHFDQEMALLLMHYGKKVSGGAEIHYNAEIGTPAYGDHLTGVVIGETFKAGDRLSILHGGTGGAASPMTAEKGSQRHPRLGDDNTMYTGVNLLGSFTSGDEVIFGSGVTVFGDDLKIGEGCRFGLGCHVSGHGMIIGDNVIIGEKSECIGHGIRIGNDVRLGKGVTVIGNDLVIPNGVRIPDGTYCELQEEIEALCRGYKSDKKVSKAKFSMHPKHHDKTA